MRSREVSENRQKNSLPTEDNGEVKAFWAHLHGACILRVKWDRERHAFERGRYKSELEEQDRDQAKRKKKRGATQKLELEKLKLMM